MNKKDLYIFPAIFDYADDGISISFPDLAGCLSCADNDEEALYMAKDALRGHLLTLEDMDIAIPNPTNLCDIELLNNQKVILIEVCLAFYREANNHKAVKKTLTIPAWLNDIATKEHVNFSLVLQKALINELNLTK